jgi:hypothetical protein
MITQRYLVLLLALVLVAPAAQAQGAGGTTTFRLPLTETLFNECTGEDVTLEGTLHVVALVREQSDGTFMLSGRANAGGVKGTGTSGDSYVGSGQASFSQPFAGLPATVDAQARFRLDRRGPGGTARGTATLRVTVDADGNPTLEIMNVVLDCQTFHSVEDS